ncbi:DoxX family protein [Brevundimonas sp. AJA228-03]|uniref:DoxX family protein n=1 Tax=Brevundimonas sp. AJA228-03 TaxID=2752515 RepID=UPI001ADFFBBF|nr:DoxX family protein [Brevundimonas sp. AJA228-03]QTN19466.1 DoxX family protein [Brevundimonas sp. AJA228-03]
MSTSLAPPASTRPTLSAAQIRNRAAFRNLTLWTLQGWVAMFFAAAGYAKLTESISNLTALMNWPGMVSESLVRGIGIVEIVLALGMIAPLLSWKLGRWPLLVSAVGLVMLEATMLAVHAIGLDLGLALTNVLLLAITIPVYLGRRVSR